MPRLNFDITIKQHQQLKTLASYSGMSMKEFILSRVFVDAAETVFTPRKKSISSGNELKSARDMLFKKAEIVVASEESWDRFKNKAASSK